MVGEGGVYLDSEEGVYVHDFEGCIGVFGCG